MVLAALRLLLFFSFLSCVLVSTCSRSGRLTCCFRCYPVGLTYFPMCGWSSVVVLMPYACVFLLCAPGLVLAYCLIVSCACVCLRLCLLVSFLAVWSDCSLSPLVSCSFATVFSCYLLFPCGYSLALSFAAAFSLTCLLFWLLVLCTASRVCSCYWCVVTDSSTCLCCLLRVPLLCSFPVNFWFTGLWFFLPLLCW